MMDDNGSPSIRAKHTARIEARWNAIFDIIAEIWPATVRQTYYQCEVHGVVDKTDNGYRYVANALSGMRKEGRLPYEWVTDNTSLDAQAAHLFESRRRARGRRAILSQGVIGHGGQLYRNLVREGRIGRHTL